MYSNAALLIGKLQLCIVHYINSSKLTIMCLPMLVTCPGTRVSVTTRFYMISIRALQLLHTQVDAEDMFCMFDS